MRLGLGLAVLVLGVLTACTDKAAKLGAEWGCGAIDGLKRFEGPEAPRFILIGEFVETNEAPAAFAELACQLAARQAKKDGPLFIGISQYFGGATDAEKAMVVRLDRLKSMGAPVLVGPIGGAEHGQGHRNRTALEKEWARILMAKVESAGASSGLFLMPRADAIAAPLARRGERFAGYSPMATNLPEGEVLALEIGGSTTRGLDAPAIRLYRAMQDGFDGQIALARLTRPLVEADLSPVSRHGGDPSENMMRFLESTGQSRANKLAVLTRYFELRDQKEMIRRAERREQLAAEIKDPAMVDILAPSLVADPMQLRPELRAEAEMEMWELIAAERNSSVAADPAGNMPSEFYQALKEVAEFKAEAATLGL